MTRVAVSQRIDVHIQRQESRDALDQRLMAFLVSCGLTPVPVPNSLGGELPGWLASVRPQAVLLSGGNDLGECPDRDATEHALLQHAHDLRLPLLGICRGMQMMGQWGGVSLQSVQGHLRTRHQLSGMLTQQVNSYHQFALASCPQGYEVLACSGDGHIEAIRHLHLPWEGWMWHPEREPVFSQHDLRRGRKLLHAGARHSDPAADNSDKESP
jgi:gamma-glutamyl-gamma-aminobutyrate hydrolase PuuD